MADKERLRPPPIEEYPRISRAGYLYYQQIAQEINRIRAGTTHGTSVDYLEIEADGTIRFYGNATTWKDINLDLLQFALGAAAPDIGTISGGNIKYLLFDGNATTEEVSGHVEIQHDVKLDVLKPHLHWLPTTTGTGNVQWNLTYTITNTGQAQPAEQTLTVIQAAGGAITNKLAVFSDIDVSAFTEGAQFDFRLWRDPTVAGDTYAADTATKTFGLHVEIQSLGTRTVIDD